MDRTTSTLLIIWNLVLTAVLAWILLRADHAPSSVGTAPNDPGTDTPALAPTILRDSLALKDARIAYFRMDSLQKRFEMIEDRNKRFQNEGQRLESTLQKELAKAQQRYAELMNKDHTYSTKEEIGKDEREVQEMGQRVQELQARSEQQLAQLEGQMLQEISDELKSFLQEFNKTGGFDYIFSVQNGGQIWVGNEQLDVTDELVNGLNARYRARQKAAGKK
jgi:outer membrane protein